MIVDVFSEWWPVTSADVTILEILTRSDGISNFLSTPERSTGYAATDSFAKNQKIRLKIRFA
jgi:hypothetical protein